MIDKIMLELLFFKACLFSGFMLSMFYDMFRILRRVFRHNKYIIIIEDLLYGIVIGTYLFYLNFKNNNGALRIFVFAGLVLGIFLYVKLFSNSVVSLISNFFIKIRKKIGCLLRIVEKITINRMKRWKKLSKFRKL